MINVHHTPYTNQLVIKGVRTNIGNCNVLYTSQTSTRVHVQQLRPFGADTILTPVTLTHVRSTGAFELDPAHDVKMRTAFRGSLDLPA